MGAWQRSGVVWYHLCMTSNSDGPDEKVPHRKGAPPAGEAKLKLPARDNRELGSRLPSADNQASPPTRGRLWSIFASKRNQRSFVSRSQQDPAVARAIRGGYADNHQVSASAKPLAKLGSEVQLFPNEIVVNRARYALAGTKATVNVGTRTGISDSQNLFLTFDFADGRQVSINCLHRAETRVRQFAAKVNTAGAQAAR